MVKNEINIFDNTVYEVKSKTKKYHENNIKQLQNLILFLAK